MVVPISGINLQLSSFLYFWNVSLTITKSLTKNCFGVFPYSSISLYSLYSLFPYSSNTHTKKRFNGLITVIAWNEWWIKTAIQNSLITFFVCGLYVFFFSTCATYGLGELEICNVLYFWWQSFLQEQTMIVTLPFYFYICYPYLGITETYFLVLMWLLCFQMIKYLFSLWYRITVVRTKVKFNTSSKSVA